MVPVKGKPQKSKFRINSKELTHKLIPIHKSFNRRNLHTRANQLLPVVAGQEVTTPLLGQGPFYRGLIVKLYSGWSHRPPERTMHS